jgi:hypothetical protein
LLRRLWFVEKVAPEEVMAFAKKVQGAKPASAKSGYGIPPVSGRSTRENTAVKITMGSMGCKAAQSTPSAVWR